MSDQQTATKGKIAKPEVKKPKVQAKKASPPTISKEVPNINIATTIVDTDSTLITTNTSETQEQEITTLAKNPLTSVQELLNAQYPTPKKNDFNLTDYAPFAPIEKTEKPLITDNVNTNKTTNQTNITTDAIDKNKEKAIVGKESFENSTDNKDKHTAEEFQLPTGNTKEYTDALTTKTPMSFIKAMKTASQDVLKAQTNEQQTLVESLPEIKQPTGLPLKPKGNRNKVKQKTAQISEQFKPKETTFSEKKPKGNKEAEKIKEESIQPASSFFQKIKSFFGFGKTENETDKKAEIKSKIKNLPTSDNVNTSLGQAPKVNLTGQANPAINQQNTQAAKASVKKHQSNNLQESRVYKGEDDIYPEIETEILSSSVKLSTVETTKDFEDDIPNISSELAEHFNIGAKPHMDQEIAKEKGKQADAYAKMEADQKQERLHTDTKIAEETARVKQEQENQQQKAKAEVHTQRVNWQKENEAVQKEFTTKSTTERQKVDKNIAAKTKETDQKISQEYTKAKTAGDKAVAKTNREAEAKKRKALKESESQSWWDKAINAVSSFFDSLKNALNTLFDGLRKLVKGLIEAAKKLANKLIDLARTAIVSMIKAFGEVLKGFVNIALAAFPKLQDKFNTAIDTAINIAVNIVNKLAEGLKKAVNTLLDVLGAVLDAILSAYQAAFNALLDVLKFLTVGMIKITKGLYGLGAAIYESPSHWKSQLSHEFLGQDLTQPLENLERTNEEYLVMNAMYQQSLPSESTSVENIANFSSQLSTNSSVFNPESVETEPIGIEALSPSLINYFQSLPEGEHILGKQNISKEESISSLKSHVYDINNNSTETNQTTSSNTTIQKDVAGNLPINEFYIDGKVGPFKSSGDRSKFYIGMMWDGVKKMINEKWQQYKPYIIAAGVLAGVGLIAAIIASGGAILGFLPLLLKGLLAILTIWSLSQSLPKIKSYLSDYATFSWPADPSGITKGGKKFIRAMALGLLELIGIIPGAKAGIKGSQNLAKLISKRGIKGVKTFAKMGARQARNTFRGASQSGKRVFQTTISKGQNIAQSFAKVGKLGLKKGAIGAIKTKNGLVHLLKRTFKYLRKIRVRIFNGWFQLGIDVNPFYVLIQGKLAKIDKSLVSKADKMEIPQGTTLKFLEDGKYVSRKATENLTAIWLASNKSKGLYSFLNASSENLKMFNNLLASAGNKVPHEQIVAAIGKVGIGNFDNTIKTFQGLAKHLDNLRPEAINSLFTKLAKGSLDEKSFTWILNNIGKLDNEALKLFNTRLTKTGLDRYVKLIIDRLDESDNVSTAVKSILQPISRFEKAAEILTKKGYLELAKIAEEGLNYFTHVNKQIKEFIKTADDLEFNTFLNSYRRGGKAGAKFMPKYKQFGEGMENIRKLDGKDITNKALQEVMKDIRRHHIFMASVLKDNKVFQKIMQWALIQNPPRKINFHDFRKNIILLHDKQHGFHNKATELMKDRINELEILIKNSSDTNFEEAFLKLKIILKEETDDIIKNVIQKTDQTLDTKNQIK